MAKALVIKGANFSENKVAKITIAERVPCTGITLSKSALSFDDVDISETLIASVTPYDCTDAIVWASSDDSVASVNSSGIVTAKTIGTATITASCGSYSATCVVDINVIPSYVLVSGYIPERRSATGPAATTGKKDAETNSNHVLATNSDSSSIYPIESKADVDTSPYRFVPIIIPNGAAAIKISSANGTTELKTRILFFDRNTVETQFGIGALCLDGKKATDGFDQADWGTSQTVNVPAIDGVNSFGGLVYLRNSNNPAYEDYADLINVEFLTE